jgi:excisionase family DNA binding protein
MNHVKEWLTIKEAAFFVGRGMSTVYRWVAEGRIESWRDTQGRTLVATRDVTRVEANVQRGRPIGTTNKGRN